MKLFKWIKHRLLHKLEHLKFSNLIDTLKQSGLALLVIILVWELIEDIGFPIIFAWLGANVHPAFLVGIPASWLLCLHWLAVPIIWGAWIKIRGKNETS
tara:strand:- start:1401 stop:1697 length:297 start_codon:yes stop_codon:yes gene_type:complete